MQAIQGDMADYAERHGRLRGATWQTTRGDMAGEAIAMSRPDHWPWIACKVA